MNIRHLQMLSGLNSITKYLIPVPEQIKCLKSNNSIKYNQINIIIVLNGIKKNT